MSTRKLYDNRAERQAAYRRRHPEKRPPSQAELATLARSLHAVFRSAVENGASKLPAELLKERPDATLSSLIRWLDPAPDPVRYAAPAAQKEDAAVP